MKTSHFSLIPRVRVNYSIGDVLNAIFVSENSESGRQSVKEFLTSYFRVEDVLLTSSGRAGLYMILRSLPHKIVYVPAYTCMVVVEAVLLAGKEIKYLPTSGESFNADNIKDIQGDTIVVATHQYGLPCDIERIVEEAHQKNCIVIEDCAAAFGSRVNGRLVGTFGDYAFFSFDPSKLINVPQKAGFIIAKDSSLLNNIADTTPVSIGDKSYKKSGIREGLIYALLKNKLIYRIFHYITMGRKNKMQLSEHNTPSLEMEAYYKNGFSEWQASFVLKQLKQLDSLIQRRNYLFKAYDAHLNGSYILKPVFNNDAVCVRYTIKIDRKRDLYEYCIKHGVDMGFSFNHIGAPASWKDEHHIANQILNLPFYYNLKDRELEKVVETINAWQ